MAPNKRATDRTCRATRLILSAVTISMGLVVLNLPAVRAQETQVTTEVAPKSGAVQPATPTTPVRTEVRKFESWSVTCEYGKDDQKIGCGASLRVNQQGTGRALLNWSLGKDADGKLVQSVLTMPGVQIPPGVQVKAGDMSGVSLSYASCSGTACLASGPLEAEFLHKAIKAPSIAIVVRAIDGKDYTFTFAASGIGEAAAAVQDN